MQIRQVKQNQFSTQGIVQPSKTIELPDRYEITNFSGCRGGRFAFVS